MNYLSGKANRLTPYVAGIQPREAGWIKLNTNENPYPPSPAVTKAIGEVSSAKLKLYPDTLGGPLRKALAEHFGLGEEYIFCGNGSDEVIALCYQAFFSGESNVLTPDISYGFYPVWAELYDVELTKIPLRDDYSLVAADYQGGNGVVLANPNAPTGTALTLPEIEQLAQRNPNGVVLVDEAYIDFAGVDSAVSLITKYPNLLVVRTFSKSHSLAGLRVGYAIGDPALIEGLRRCKDAFNSYPLDQLAQAGAAAAIQDVAYWEETRRQIIQTRDQTTERLRALGYPVIESHANFLFVKAPDAKGMYEHLLKNKILARYWDKPRLSEFLRITIGTDAEMEALIQCVSQF
ncbi:MAG: histidinol-phosphate transaminase [Oscillospiraceae bacterium]|nr:histidinol-phosphate transaminase [Oscillospiraceae bacterium]